MRVGVPTNCKGGLIDAVHERFERAPCLAIVDTTDGSITVVPNDPGETAADAVAARCIAADTVAGLQARGIAVHATPTGSVAEAVIAVMDGELPAFGPGGGCRDGESPATP